ncbi:DUF6571 family protein [Microtetraspora malaysiensis]|uniref:DUF6571 family protein n=1 Tax=Microtetraspora malaysiensis TaxID=161358 RepID=UPI000ADC5E0D|nr:DUF6571 family protein [Microtetraspora malaysiensis]
MEQKPPGTGPLSPDYSGIDPELMTAFITSLTHGRDVIKEEAEAIRRLLLSVNMPTMDLQQFGPILGWIETELPKLRRRNQTIQSSNNIQWIPGVPTGLVPINEKALLSQADAQRQGQALAERFANTFAGDWGWPGGKYNDGELADLVAELAAHRNDADFTAAFFAALGAEKTLAIPAKLRSGMKDPKDAIDTVSHAFGTAVRHGAHVPGFAETRYEIVTGKNPGPLFQTQSYHIGHGSAATSDFAELRDSGEVTPAGGNQALGDLLRAGEFPAAWLSAVVSLNALNSKSTVNDEGLAGYLYALGNNPKAARMAISTATKKYGSLSEALRRLNERAKVKQSYDWQADLQEKENSRADAFGRMLAAASGAYDEKDGAHSKEAAQLAFNLMTTLPSLKIAEPTRVHLAEIAGSYATEIVEGANLGDANRTQDSAFGNVKTIIPGLKPAFRLSPKDTYEFVKIFADSQKNIKPFEEGIGNLADKLINMAAAKDDGKGIEYLGRAMRAFGYVARLQFAAESEVQGNLDALDQQRIKVKMFAVGLALGIGGLAVPGMGGQVLWLGISTLTPPGVESLIEIDKTRMDALEDKIYAASLARESWMVNMLMAHGFKAKVPPNDASFSTPPITGDDGNLLSLDKIAEDKGAFMNFNNWLIANGSGGVHKEELGEAYEWLKTIFNGARTGTKMSNQSWYE